MIDLISLQIFRNALYMSIVLSILFGIISFFVVLRKMAFLGAGISHTAFGGVALGVLLAIDPFLTSLGFCLLSAIIIGRIVRYSIISYDTSIGIFFAFSMALGSLFISLKKSYTFDLTGYLFGNILAVKTHELWVSIAVLLLFLIFFGVYYHRLIFLSFDKEAATVSGIATNYLDDLLLLFLTLIIVISIKSVGIILISALIVLPASFGLLWSKNYRYVFIIGVFFTITIMLLGITISNSFDLPTGASIVVIGTLTYFISLSYVFIWQKINHT